MEGRKITIAGNNPAIGYHTLKLLEYLRQSFYDAGKKIESAEKLNRVPDYEKIKRLENLRKYREEILTEFNTWSEYVRKWVSEFSDKDELYGDVIIEYYCDINNSVSLRKIIEEEVLREDNDKNRRPQNLQHRIRTITLNQVQKQ